MTLNYAVLSGISSLSCLMTEKIAQPVARRMSSLSVQITMSWLLSLPWYGTGLKELAQKRQLSQTAQPYRMTQMRSTARVSF